MRVRDASLCFCVTKTLLCEAGAAGEPTVCAKIILAMRLWYNARHIKTGRLFAAQAKSDSLKQSWRAFNARQVGVIIVMLPLLNCSVSRVAEG